MKSKVLKIGTVLLACVCLISIFAVPVSALGSTLNGLNIIDCYSFEGDNIEVQGLGCSTYDSTQFEKSIKCLLIDDGGPFAEYVYLQDRCTSSFKVQFLQTGFYTFDIAYEKLLIYNATLTDTSFSVSSTINAEVVTMGNRVINSETFGTSKIKVKVTQANTDLYLNLTGECISEHQTDGSLDLYFYNVSCTEDETQKIIDNQNQNANEIIANQNANTQAQIDADKENTEQITNGWQGADSIDDSSTDDLKNAEDAALGGKTDEEIEEEISGALEFDFNSFSDSGGFNRVRVLFGNIYNVLGSSWQSLFLLSLTLGLGAFLIGRRYG